MINLDELTIGDAKKLASMFGGNGQQIITSSIDNFCHGKVVIIRTYSAGVWAGTLSEKSKDEVILKNARRMWKWHSERSISLSAVAVHGINQSKSKIAPPVNEVWLMPIEILPFCTAQAEKSVMEASHVEAQ
jgi:hypothetical protein